MKLCPRCRQSLSLASTQAAPANIGYVKVHRRCPPPPAPPTPEPVVAPEAPKKKVTRKRKKS